MKSVYSKEYYERNFDRFIGQGKYSENYINLEEELKSEMKFYKSLNLGSREIGLIENAVSKMIYETANKLVHKQLEIIKRLESGESSFGFTTYRQEMKARQEYLQRFEFNCYQIEMFCRKYKIEDSGDVVWKLN